MSWVITGSEKNPVDLYRSQVSLLLHGDGANGSTTITDSSPTPKTVTAVGNAQINTTVTDAFGRTGVGVIAFDGTGDYLSIPTDVFDITTQDFTVEWWQKLASTSVTYNSIALASESGFRASNGVLQYYNIAGVGTINVAASTTNLTTNWQHIAFARQSNVIRLFLNGVLLSNNLANVVGSNSLSYFRIGQENTSYANAMNGYIDDLRVTKGIARYTANFTPPTAPFPDI